MTTPLSRPALARVLQSLLTAELAAAHGRQGRGVGAASSTAGVWPEDLRVSDQAGALGCDSLELLGLTAAVNEMFHLYEARCEAGLLAAETFGQWLDVIEAAWEAGVASITFSTSGSTGIPKRCVHQLAQLRLEVDFLAELFSGRERVICLCPEHHIYGFLFGAMLVDALGAGERAAAGSLERLAQSLRPGDLVVAAPVHWQWLERTISAWPDDVAGVTSTGPCPPELVEALVARGLSGLTEIYGSTETAGVGFRAWPESRYRLMPHWRREESEEPGRPVRLISSLGRQVALMDNLRIEEDGSFLVEARRDGAVQVGGTNVYPARIAALLQGQKGVQGAAVRLMRQGEGNRLKAFLVAEAGVDSTMLLQAIERWMAISLSTAERPAAITFGAELPRNALGKDADW